MPTTNVMLRADLACDSFLEIPAGNPAVTIDLGGHSWSVPPDPRCERRCGLALSDQSGTLTVVNGVIDGQVIADHPAPIGQLSPGKLTMTRVRVTRSLIATGGNMDLSHIDAKIGFEGGVLSVRHSVLHGVFAFGSEQPILFDVIGNTIDGQISLNQGFASRYRSGGTIANNTIRGPGAGIVISGVTDSYFGPITISGNTITDSRGDGIQYHQSDPTDLVALTGPVIPGPILISNNIFRRNQGHAINITGPHNASRAAGVIDGGGNRAQNNALMPQCLQIRCGRDARAIPDVNWSHPLTLTISQPLGVDQLDATASVPGSFTYDPPAGATFTTAGSYTIQAHFVPDDLVHYQPTDRVVWLFVTAP